MEESAAQAAFKSLRSIWNQCLTLLILLVIEIVALTISAMGSLIATVVALCWPFLWAAIISIRAIRKEHSSHIYLLWYVFSLTACCTSLTFFYLDNIQLVEVSRLSAVSIAENGSAAPIWQRTVQWFLSVSTDLNEELILVSVILFVIVIPQVISFVLSGIFGCGKPPLIISKALQGSVMSLIKFCSILAGIEMATFILKIYKLPGFDDKIILFVGKVLNKYRDLVACSGFLAGAFGISAAYYRAGSIIKRSKCWRVGFLITVGMYMTRFTDSSLEKDADGGEDARIPERAGMG